MEEKVEVATAGAAAVREKMDMARVGAARAQAAAARAQAAARARAAAVRARAAAARARVTVGRSKTEVWAAALGVREALGAVNTVDRHHIRHNPQGSCQSLN